MAWFVPAPRVFASTPRVFVGGYYVHDDPLSWETLRTYGNRLAWVITTNFVIADATGTLRGEHDARVMAMARTHGLEIHFRVSNLARGEFDRALAHAILTNPATRARAIADILKTVDVYDYNGVNIDLENIAPVDREALTSFMRDLGAALEARRKSLSIAIPGKTSDAPTDSWSGAFDLAALGAIADRVIIMAYDEHWEGGSPGPVASLPWVEAVIRYTTSQVRPEKALLGVPFYGYDWPGRGPGVGISMREAVRRSQQAGVPILWDERAKVPYFRVGDRTVYFEDARSLAYKLEARQRAGLAGIVAWRLGHELPEVWDTISRAAVPSLQVPAPPDQPVPVIPDQPVPTVPDEPIPAAPDEPVPAVPEEPIPAVPEEQPPIAPHLEPEMFVEF